MTSPISIKVIKHSCENAKKIKKIMIQKWLRGALCRDICHVLVDFLHCDLCNPPTNDELSVALRKEFRKRDCSKRPADTPWELTTESSQRYPSWTSIDALRTLQTKTIQRFVRNFNKLLDMIESLREGQKREYQLMGYKQWKLLQVYLRYRDDICYSLIEDKQQYKHKLSAIRVNSDYAAYISTAQERVPILYLKIYKKRKNQKGT